MISGEVGLHNLKPPLSNSFFVYNMSANKGVGSNS
jgi:hypothetical protein